MLSESTSRDSNHEKNTGTHPLMEAAALLKRPQVLQVIHIYLSRTAKLGEMETRGDDRE